ncbi:MAG: nickel-dependent hydrogenase large subunit [DPANN group archaeon]|nr:nickel-dependent hydrogenase large subunit [DPANN group archaeon]
MDDKIPKCNVNSDISNSIPIGPQHPALLEPEYFNIRLDGETIIDADINVGYLHRGIEAALEKKDYVQSVFLTERICGICSSHHTIAYCGAIELLHGAEIPMRAKYIRTIIAELERIHSHMLWLGVVGYEIGLDTLFQLVWRDREHVMDLLEKISGNRVNYAMNKIGGVRRDLDPKILSEISKTMDIIKKQVIHYIDIVSKDNIVILRTKDIGILSKEDAKKYSAVGPVARASGIKYDVRDTGYEAYKYIRFDVITETKGDVFSKVVVRAKELIVSSDIVKHCVKHIPKGDIYIKLPLIVPSGEVVTRVEAPRGELIYYVKSDGTNKPARVKIRTPTYANLLSVKTMLIGHDLADVPVIVVGALDPCFACTDRVTILKQTGNEILDASNLRSIADKKYN